MDCLLVNFFLYLYAVMTIDNYIIKMRNLVINWNDFIEPSSKIHFHFLSFSWINSFPITLMLHFTLADIESTYKKKKQKCIYV